MTVEGPPDRAPVEPRRVEAGEDGVVVVMRRARVVSGRVVDPEGSPVGGAVLWVPDRRGLTGEWESVVADVDGRFRIESAPVGTFPVRVGLPRWSAEEARAAEAQVGPTPGEVTLRAPPAGTIVLRVVGAPEGLRLTGYLTSERGPDGEEDASPRAERLLGGVARFEGVSPGPHGFWLGPLPGGRYALARGLRPGPSEQRITLQEGVAAKGRLVGFPRQAHMNVRIWGPEVFATALVDDRGGFEFEALPPGEWKVHAHAHGNDGALEGTATLSPGAEVEIPLAPR